MIEPVATTCTTCPLNYNSRCPMVSKKVRAGTQVWSQGDVPREVAFIKEGLFSLSSTEPSGTEALSSVRGPKTLLGTEALQGYASPATLEALTDGTLCVAEPAVLKQWMGPPSPSQAMFQMVVDELGRNARDLTLRTGPSLARVARFILEFASLVDAGRKAPFSKQHVARLLGMRAETLSRCLRELVDGGMIESGRHITVLNADKLAVVARSPN